jgi:hypothetical protein
MHGQIEDVAIEMLNPFMKGEFASTFQVEGARISPQRVLIDPQIITFEHFDKFHYPKD